MVAIRAAAASGGPYLCYLLASTSGTQRTYVGITNDIGQRLRRHNGELSGGAKATRIGRPWEVWITVEGFPDRRSSLQFEWMWKHMAPRKSHGKKARISKLGDLLRKERWTEKAPIAKSIPLSVQIRAKKDSGHKIDPWEFDLLTDNGGDDDGLPEYVKVQFITTSENKKTTD